ncbi:putative phosphatidate phosphatase [Uloborus diversus]|uniref:putative phosphatidate phosphatase n=1 Tax=Uloborus diversus TaxID=327109 RepID=UPI00240A13AE|nr:putative phosphatidate phosphatase [Uloborus diversus]
MQRKNRAATRVLIDLILLFIVSAPIPLFYGTFTPYRRGFYCDDETLQYPYKKSTISDPMLYGIGTAIGFIVICITEIIKCKIISEKETIKWHFCGLPVPAVLKNIYCYSVVFFFGASLTELTTDIMKFVTGRLRPNFFDSCIPDVDCTSLKDIHIHVQNYMCLNINQDVVSDSRLSFPSGHASFATYTMLYTVLYLEKRISWKSSKLLKPFIQYLFLLIGLLTALSRIADHKHHWSDVLTGFILGLVVCLIMVFKVSNVFVTDLKHLFSNDAENHVKMEIINT